MRTQLATALVLAGILLPASAAHGQNPLPEVSPEATVNTFTAGDQTAPAVAASASGAVWIAWFDLDQIPPEIKARRYGSAGAPLSPEISVHSFLGFSTINAGPRIGATADGGCVVVWAESPDVWFRRFGPDGAPLGGQQQVDPPGSSETVYFPEVAVASDGSFVVAWVQSGLVTSAIRAQRFNPQGQSLGTPLVISGLGGGGLRVAGAADGGFLVVWTDPPGAIFARRYVGATGTGSAIQQVNVAGTGNAFNPAVGLTSDGLATVAWITRDAVWVRRLGITGEPSGPVVQVGEPEPIGISSPAVATAEGGKTLVVWSGPGMTLQGRLLKDDLTPLSGVFPAADPAFVGTDPALATTPSGDVALAWSSGFAFHFPFENPPPIAGRDGDGQGIAARIFAPLRCATGSDVLCLGPNHRFEARVAWKNPATGETGAGHSLPLTADTGAFWFFGDQNLELMVKVLDGTSVNLRYWLYAGALSNVEYTLTVTDTLTGVERTYHNPAGQFASFADVTAFPFGLSAEKTEKTAARVERAVACGDFAGLCLSAGQFLVGVSFTDPRTGLAAAATAVPLTGDTGAFWFFDDSNLELMIKVLDGRAINGKFWVFYGALSDVEYTITVANTKTGELRTYYNPKGTLASHADIQAF
jgi:hypothetical protein